MHQVGHIEDHGVGAAVLEALAVDAKPHRQILRIADFVGRHQPRANGAEGVAALTLVPGAASLDLVFTLGHIVDDKNGRASCRERVCLYVKISVVAGSFKKKKKSNKTHKPVNE